MSKKGGILYKDFTVPLLLLKTAFFLPFFHSGYLLNKLDKRNLLSINHYLLFAIIGVIFNVAILLFYSSDEISFYSLAFMRSFRSIPSILPFILGLSGIFFYLYISKLLVIHKAGENDLINLISNHTLQILCIHLFIFNLLNLFFYFLHLNFGVLAGFDCNSFFSFAWYRYTPFPGYSILYFFLGVFIPILPYLMRNKRFLYS